MDESYQIVLAGLKKKIRTVVNRYEMAVARNAQLESELASYKTLCETNKTRVKELEEKTKKLQLIEAFKSSPEDVKEAKKKISKLVKEVDACIALLNDE